MGDPAVDDKASDTLVVVSGEGFWTGSSTLPHLHQHSLATMADVDEVQLVVAHPIGEEMPEVAVLRSRL